MPWSSKPDTYPEIFFDLLDFASEARETITLSVPIGEEGKFRGQFYAFKTAWEKHAEREEKNGNLALAAQARANSELLMRYGILKEPGKITFINKNTILERKGVKIEASQKKATDGIVDRISIRGGLFKGGKEEKNLKKTSDDSYGQEQSAVVKKLFGFSIDEREASPIDAASKIDEDEKREIEEELRKMQEDGQLPSSNE